MANLSNFTNSVPAFQDELTFGKLFVPIFRGSLAAVGLPGNVLLMYLTISHQEIRSQGYTWILFNLALADLGYCFQNVFFQPIFIIYYESVGCKVAGFLEFWFGLPTFFLTACVAVNRFVKVAHPEYYDTIFTTRTMICFNLLPWIYYSIILLPYPLWGMLGFEEMQMCGIPTGDSMGINAIFNVTIMIPIFCSYTTIIICYRKFLKKLHRHAQDMSYLNSPIVKESRKLMRATVLICIIPLVAQFPCIFNKTIVFLKVIPIYSFHTWMTRVLVSMFPLTSSLDPYITLYMVKPYKNAVKEMFGRNIEGTTAAADVQGAEGRSKATTKNRVATIAPANGEERNSIDHQHPNCVSAV